MDGVSTDALMRPTTRENEAVVSVPIRTVLHLTKHRECLIGQRHFEISLFLDLHSLGWDRPELLVVINLRQSRAPALFQPDASQDQEAQHARRRETGSLAYRRQLGIERGKLAIGQRCDRHRLPCLLARLWQEALQSLQGCWIAFAVRRIQDAFNQCAELHTFAVGRSQPDRPQNISDFLSRDAVNRALHQWPSMQPEQRPVSGFLGRAELCVMVEILLRQHVEWKTLRLWLLRIVLVARQ